MRIIPIWRIAGQALPHAGVRQGPARLGWAARSVGRSSEPHFVLHTVRVLERDEGRLSDVALGRVLYSQVIETAHPGVEVALGGHFEGHMVKPGAPVIKLVPEQSGCL